MPGLGDGLRGAAWGENTAPGRARCREPRGRMGEGHLPFLGKSTGVDFAAFPDEEALPQRDGHSICRADQQSSSLPRRQLVKRGVLQRGVRGWGLCGQARLQWDMWPWPCERPCSNLQLPTRGLRAPRWLVGESWPGRRRAWAADGLVQRGPPQPPA